MTVRRMVRMSRKIARWSYRGVSWPIRHRRLPRRHDFQRWLGRLIGRLVRHGLLQVSSGPADVAISPATEFLDTVALLDFETAYRVWMRNNEPTVADLDRQRAHCFQHAPTISVIVPVYNCPEQFLSEMIDSVRRQTYPNWELCLADGASTAPWVRRVMETAAAQDRRIKVAFLDKNLGISGNTNAALAMATGEWVSLLDHDDTLAPFALHEVVAGINAHPEADMFYSDEDKLDEHGHRVGPHFKPDFALETLLSQNYICHLTTARTSMIREIGGLRPDFDGSQDYDLVLRLVEKARKVVHIPKVLYHWRMHMQSTALNPGSKLYAFTAGQRAIADHLKRVGLPGEVTIRDNAPGLYKICYRWQSTPLVSIIIPNRDQPKMLERCLRSLEKTTYSNVEIVIVENGSQLRETFDLYQRWAAKPNVRILRWEMPFNYGAVNNFAVREARGELVLLMNNDIEVINPDWLEHMVGLATKPGVGVVGAKLYYPDKSVQHAGVIIGMGEVAGHVNVGVPGDNLGYLGRLVCVQNFSAVTGACMMVRKEIYEEVGGLDEEYPLCYSDIDLCLKILQAGYRNAWTPDAELYHHESKTRGPEDTPAKIARYRAEVDRFHRKWLEFRTAGDPFFNRNFRLDIQHPLPRVA